MWATTHDAKKLTVSKASIFENNPVTRSRTVVTGSLYTIKVPSIFIGNSYLLAWSPKSTPLLLLKGDTQLFGYVNFVN